MTIKITKTATPEGGKDEDNINTVQIAIQILKF